VLGVQYDNPQPYLPGDRRLAIADGRELPDRGRRRLLLRLSSSSSRWAEASQR
jgi:hypothetical protein